MKDVEFIQRKAPSLGWESQLKVERTDLIGANREWGYKSAYRMK